MSVFGQFDVPMALGSNAQSPVKSTKLNFTWTPVHAATGTFQTASETLAIRKHPAPPPGLWIRTPYPHNAGKLWMLVHANLYRAIEYGRSGAFRLFQRFEQRDGPDLTAVFQPDSELTPSNPNHNMAVQ